MRIAISSVMTFSSRTYLASTRGNDPNARGWALVALAMSMGSESVQKLMNSARKARCFCSSFMLLGFTLTSPDCTRSKNVFQSSLPRIFAISAIDLPSKRLSPPAGICATSTLSQLLPT